MDRENPPTIEKLESKKESSIHLENISFDFCHDDFIDDYFSPKLREIEDKAKWLRESRADLELHADKITKAVEDGLIANAEPETIWQFQVDKLKSSPEKVKALRDKLESHIEEMTKDVAKKLSRYLPDWTSGNAKVIFTINDEANFCINEDTITVDLSRLLHEENVMQKVIQGVTHEVFHLWMSEGSKWSDSKEDEISDQELKDSVIFRTIDEGIAVLISGESLEEHHAKEKDFKKYIHESFTYFNRFLAEQNRKSIEEIEHEAFQNMGHFYVVGNEIAKTILQHDGIELFKKLIVDAKKNPVIALQRYKEICDEDSALQLYIPFSF